MAEAKSTKGKIQRLLQDEELKPGERLYSKGLTAKKAPAQLKSSAWQAANSREDSLIDAIDQRRQIEKVAAIFEKIDRGAIDVTSMFQGVSPEVGKQLLYIAMCGENEKNRLDALKHLLALAGHNPAQRHEISRIDPSTPRSALLAMISGAAKELQDEGVEVVDDRTENKDKP